MRRFLFGFFTTLIARMDDFARSLALTKPLNDPLSLLEVLAAAALWGLVIVPLGVLALLVKPKDL
jgi:hypothetical protein